MLKRRMRSARKVTLQKRAGKWHAGRFPDAQASLVLLKALTELGEVADAYLDQEGSMSATGERGDGISGEAADVVIALMVLTDRWTEENLLEAVERKLSLLETPGAHKASSR